MRYVGGYVKSLMLSGMLMFTLYCLAMFGHVCHSAMRSMSFKVDHSQTFPERRTTPRHTTAVETHEMPMTIPVRNAQNFCPAPKSTLTGSHLRFEVLLRAHSTKHEHLGRTNGPACEEDLPKRTRGQSIKVVRQQTTGPNQRLVDEKFRNHYISTESQFTQSKQ